MKTKLWNVDKPMDKWGDYPQIEEAAELLRKNEVVAFPTETVYGLGANAASDDAVAKVFEAKGRPGDNPLIVHIGEIDQLAALVENVPEGAKRLIDAFWPGPLTILLAKREGAVSEKVTPGLDTVGIRMPDHPVARALINAAGVPVAAPSANRSGRPSPTTAAHVEEDLSGKIAGIVDAGATGVGVESTVIDLSGGRPVILRPGGISKEEIERVIGPVFVDAAVKDSEAAPKAPGMKYKHYAPKSPLFLVDGDPEWLQRLIDEKRNEGLKVGVLAPAETAPGYQADFVIECGSRDDLASVARSLYDGLRAFDEKMPDIIFAEAYPEKGVGAAIMNRLEKAASHQWIRQN